MSIGKVKSDSSAKLIIIITLIVIVLGVGAFFGYKEYNDLKRENQRLSNPEEATKSEVEKTKNQVSSLIEVPTDEEPTIANVVDVSKLSNQEFFKNAQNGDKLLVYQKAKKAILYRPSTDKIIEVSTISLGEEKDTDSETKTQSTQPAQTTPAEGTTDVTAQPGLQP